jgi:hypothetical protein
VKLDDSFKKKEETLRKVFLKDSPPTEHKNLSPSHPKETHPANKNISLLNEPQSHLKIVEEVLSDDLFEQKQAQDVQGNLLYELGLQRCTFPHKAYLLALIRASKVNKDNIAKTMVEFKAHSQIFDNECIYCKYSQYALKESLRVAISQGKLQKPEDSNEKIEFSLPPLLSFLNIQAPSQIREQRVLHLVGLF